MTIYSDSRYAYGPLFKAYDARSTNTVVTVFREWPLSVSNVKWYQVDEIDRIENLATIFLGKPELWWTIMDINPEVLNPFDIKPGTMIRIPHD
jgi:hypothetical protein